MVRLVFAMLMLMSAAARADVDAYFATEVMDVPWDSSLQQVLAKYPGGLVWPNKGHNANEGYVYEFTGEFRVLGVNHPAREVRFLFSKDNRLESVSLYFRYSERDEVLYDIAQVLGQDYEVNDELRTRVFAWKPGRHSIAALMISNDARFPWAYLSVGGR